ncbi:hypothetical protein Pla175_41240 [Pirellulimonas nuda]|uniref:DUF1009 domain-containing protein n=1 Tax=Pirellulimonas nuda TaxID=2528009 RepID=A0A518DGW4_9BACT|nr:UDP-2,3-diacylglucosamine diphosphatase LpxI [Pirellulimonas nuda]QDU90713.1 hypothetical protein Pla175_41240 [Pirellulimonas nuda]
MSTTPPSIPAPDAPIGLLAAWGRFPITVAEALREQGNPVVCLGLRGHADPALAKIANRFEWTGATRLGRAIRFFRRHGARHATMAGKLHKAQFYRPNALLYHLPDLAFVRAFWPHVFARTADQRDDTLLTTLVNAFASGGVEFLPPTDFAPELLVKAGSLTGRSLTPAQQADVEFGWEMAKQMGGLDIGQSVCIKDRAVFAVEAIEGTDAAIRRAGGLCRAGGLTVVKVSKPNQDMRFDVPTVGVGTLHAMVEAGAKVLAIEADKTILLDEEAFRETAEKFGLSVVVLPSAAAAARLAA